MSVARSRGVPGHLIPTLVVALGVAVACGHAKQFRSPGEAHVGPVLVVELARVISAMDLPGEHDRAQSPFSIVVRTLRQPGEPSVIQCTWNERWLSSYRFVTVRDGTPTLDRWVEILPLADGGFDERPSPEPSRVEIDYRTEEGSVTFDQALIPRLSERAEREPTPYGRLRTYSAAFLCSDGTRVALLLDYTDGPLDGLGQLLELRKSEQGWKLVSVLPTWVS